MPVVCGDRVLAPALHDTVLQRSGLHNGVKPHRDFAHRLRQRLAELSTPFGPVGLLPIQHESNLFHCAGRETEIPPKRKTVTLNKTTPQ